MGARLIGYPPVDCTASTACTLLLIIRGGTIPVFRVLKDVVISFNLGGPFSPYFVFSGKHFGNASYCILGTVYRLSLLCGLRFGFLFRTCALQWWRSPLVLCNRRLVCVEATFRCLLQSRRSVSRYHCPVWPVTFSKIALGVVYAKSIGRSPPRVCFVGVATMAVYTHAT